MPTEKLKCLNKFENGTWRSTRVLMWVCVCLCVWMNLVCALTHQLKFLILHNVEIYFSSYRFLFVLINFFGRYWFVDSVIIFCFWLSSLWLVHINIVLLYVWFNKSQRNRIHERDFVDTLQYSLWRQSKREHFDTKKMYRIRANYALKSNNNKNGIDIDWRCTKGPTYSVYPSEVKKFEILLFNAFVFTFTSPDFQVKILTCKTWWCKYYLQNFDMCREINRRVWKQKLSIYMFCP